MTLQVQATRITNKPIYLVISMFPSRWSAT